MSRTMDKQRTCQCGSLSTYSRLPAAHCSAADCNGSCHGWLILRASLRKVTLSERSAGSGLQVAFKLECSFLGSEFERHNHVPGTVASGVHIQAGVVPPQSFAHIATDADVMSLGVVIAAKDVNEPLVCVAHMPRLCIGHT